MDIGPIMGLWQEPAIPEEPRPSRPGLAQRYRGVMLGVAVGNLIGIPVEGMSGDSLKDVFSGGLSEIDPGEKDLPWDDDVAQTAILAEALIAGRRLTQEDLAERFLRWARENGRGIGNLTWRVLEELSYGTSPNEASRLVWEAGGRQPAGNGAVMRCSPVALRWRRDPRLLVEETLASAMVTHHDPRCQWSAVAVNVALAIALDGKTVSLPELATALLAAGAPDSVGQAIQFVGGASAGQLDLDEPQSMGYTLKAMQVGLWSLAHGNGFQETLLRIVNAGGDTDTNGAVAGAVLGAAYGVEAIPGRWLGCVPDRERLEQLAGELLKASDGL